MRISTFGSGKEKWLLPEDARQLSERLGFKKHSPWGLITTACHAVKEVHDSQSAYAVGDKLMGT